MELKIFRLKKNLTQIEMAKFLGMSQGAICNIESGRRKIGAKALSKISLLTGITKSKLRPDLFDEND